MPIPFKRSDQPDLARVVSEAEAVAWVHGASAGVLEPPGKTGPFPSFPAMSHLEYQHLPTNLPHAEAPVTIMEYCA